MKKIFTLIAVALMAVGANAQTTIYSWEGGAEGATETGGKATAADADGNDTSADDINMSNSSYKCIRLRGAKDFSTYTVTLTLDKELSAGDQIAITAYRNKDAEGKKSGALLKFEKGETTATTDTDGTGLQFININSAVEGTSEYGTAPNTVIVEVPADAAGSKTITMCRAQTATNLFITKIEITTSSSTGINSVKTANESNVEYNLAGQQVDKNYKGVVVKNGKKMIQK